MPTREEIEIKERAERALRSGAPKDALALYRALLRKVTVFESGVYEGWLEGALATYQALGREREAGYVLMALRRFGEAERCFDPAKTPVEWALCARERGRRREAARVLSAAGHLAEAALTLESAGDQEGARGLWERLLESGRLRDLPYEEALALFNLGLLLRRLADAEGSRRILARAQRMLEELADDFERRGARERAFDCYGVLLQLGRQTGSFENVAEGYLNSIRLLASDDQKYYVLQYYEDFLDFAVEAREWHAAAALAREAAEFSTKAGLVYDTHYRQRAAALWFQAARHNVTLEGPPELSENALMAAIDVAAALGDLGLVGRLYAELATLPLPEKKRARYAALSRRYPPLVDPLAPGPSFPSYLRRPDAYQDVWRQDLVEWELGGHPPLVLAHVLVERTGHAPFARLALRALLQLAEDGFRIEEPGPAADLALALGNVQLYEVLRPLEDLGRHPIARVRAAVMSAVGQVYCKRSFGLVRRGLEDQDTMVREAALRALRALHFRDGLEPLARIFRETDRDEVRRVALDAIADIGNVEAGHFLLDVARREIGPLAAHALERLRGFPLADLQPTIRQYAAVESGPLRNALERLLAPVGA
jgi:tetratricopeptide (TPR) repeat protein